MKINSCCCWNVSVKILFLLILGAMKSDGKSRKSSDDDDDIFGSYAPSAISSRPGTGRSVRLVCCFVTD